MKQPLEKALGEKRGKAALSVFTAIMAIIIIITGSGFIYLQYINNLPIPQIDGTLKVNGLQANVEVIRDSYGIPYLYSQNMHDLLFAQGCVQAQDRWWQMEMYRHICGGRMEEITGRNNSLLPLDIYFRTMGWYRVAEQEYQSYAPAQRAILDAFSEGVNAYISKRSPQELSVNYSILGLTGIKFNIEPWTPLDTLAYAKLMAWDLGYAKDEEIARNKLYGILGQEMTDEWETPPWGYGSMPTILQAEDVQAMDNSSIKRLHIDHGYDNFKTVASEQSQPTPATDLSLLLYDRSGIGSNNWVATDNMTQSGKPLLANDPHLAIQLPSIWYEIGLHCADDGTGQPFDVAGFAFVAAPGVIIGHNNDIAWGVTNVYPDVHDHYQIKINPDNQSQYEWNGAWRDLTVRDEAIEFGDGSAPLHIKVRETHLGPIINENKLYPKSGQNAGLNNKDPLALHWTALQPGTLMLAVQGLDRAKNWDDFRNALRYWDTPSQNIIYADRQGNIGYQMPGKIPIRASDDNGLLPMPGWTDQYEWKGFIPFDLLPRIFNPARGYIVTANQAPVPPEYYDILQRQLGPGFNYCLGYEWNYGYRSQRINQLITQLAPNTIQSFQKIQGDNELLSVAEIMPYLKNIQFSDPALADARDWLTNWDYTFDENSPQAALYAEFWMKLVENVFQSKIGDSFKVHGNDREMWAISLLLQKPDDKWWDDPSTKDIIETRDDMLAKCFKEGYDATVKELGSDRSSWEWGKLHTATFLSVPLGLSGIAPLESLVNQGPFPASGSAEAVNATRWDFDNGNLSVRECPSMRMIIDMGDLSKSVSMNLTGQSGHPASPWYSDMIKPWLNIQYHSMLWTRQQIDAAAAHKLILGP
ncbi:MAG: penicillin acylase family protein [Dehalococcoidia bacterium]